ncbi:MAG: hypothetical protein Q7S58_00150 [Candidatus Binatus sp.]|uniref:Nmad3 family putative nucleotide modification protein n=1 Tax=Candidatus Binatus sp. TaxID=2811406 RepID=UPI00271786BC|nr:hypothetical protein [Candidatus Binatus sp.]MDO8430796.1 hypothetical protein [Candidatus Binatus sp.]
MKLIFSRKGFDAKYGGCASPILEDGSLCSLPIPDPNAPTRFRDIQLKGASIAPMVEALTRARITASDGAHLDPDLRGESIVRAPGWRPIFGQADAAASHLANNGVGAGDLFLFFGWFRQTTGAGCAISFVPGAPNLHVIFGWMEVGAVHPMSDRLIEAMPWARMHPHFVERERYRNNTVYVASERLDSLGLASAGAGAFDCIRPELILTQLEPYLGRSTWRMPACFEPRGRTLLTRHQAGRWSSNGATVQLRSVPIGQEFVLDIGEYPDVKSWACNLFTSFTSKQS